jgi:response regulator RpfG family c-di-GMP phosphodiesterase
MFYYIVILNSLKGEKGAHFDPTVVDVFISILK